MGANIEFNIWIRDLATQSNHSFVCDSEGMAK
ncbi:hypothetical protein GY50_1348 [Dehalococcoides mccartyi GY50]|nr:hypothetical protein GY50_1348 [Dehalococcoides mccartyi GY50]